MGIVLGPNQYGKAECRVVRIVRDTARHEIRDLNVSTSLRGDFAAAHVAGDQSQVLPTDTQKNTAFAYAKKHGVTSPEDYALALARRLLEATPAATGARIRVEEYAWDRIPVDGAGHDHAFVRRGGEVRTTEVDLSSEGAHVVSGLTDLVVLKSTGSEFTGFLVDEYTTLPEAEDRILATSLTATWRYSDRGAVAWNRTYDEVRALLLATFATTYSRALQETLYAMGRAVLEAHPGIEEISFAAPNKHHFLVDLEPFGLDNPGRGLHRRGPALRADRGDRGPGAGESRERQAGLRPTTWTPRAAGLLTCLDVPRWADEVLAGPPLRRPRTRSSDRMVAASSTLTDDELERALARHPRIGERADAAAHDAAHSTREQAGVDRDDAGRGRAPGRGQPGLRGAVRPGLHHPRGGPRRPRDPRATLRRRLDNSDEAERAETVDQLTQIAVLRAREVLG